MFKVTSDTVCLYKKKLRVQRCRIHLVMSQGHLGHTKMAANFGFKKPSLSPQEIIFIQPWQNTKLAVLASEVHTLL